MTMDLFLMTMSFKMWGKMLSASSSMAEFDPHFSNQIDIVLYVATLTFTYGLHPLIVFWPSSTVSVHARVWFSNCKIVMEDGNNSLWNLKFDYQLVYVQLQFYQECYWNPTYPMIRFSSTNNKPMWIFSKNWYIIGFSQDSCFSKLSGDFANPLHTILKMSFSFTVDFDIPLLQNDKSKYLSRREKKM